MSLYRTDYDVDTLATALLPMLKAQSRIDRADEETQAQEIIARVIGRVERQCGIAIAPQAYAWMPRDPTQRIAQVGWDVWRDVPVPVRGFTEITGTDVDSGTLTLTLRGDVDQLRFGRAWVERQPSGMQPSDLLTIKAGYTTAEAVPPELRDTLIRYAAALWENREAWGNNVDVMPEWVTEALGIFWVPEV